MNTEINAANSFPTLCLRGTVLFIVAVVLGLAGLCAQATDQDAARTLSKTPLQASNSAVVFLCPWNADSVANYWFLNALAGLSSGHLRVVVRPTQIQGTKDLLLFEAAYATRAQGRGNQMLDRALPEFNDVSRVEFRHLAQSLRLDLQQFQRDLDQHTYLAVVTEDLLAAEGLGVGPTTTFMNGLRTNGRLTADRIEAISSSFRVPLPAGAIGAAVEFDALTMGFVKGQPISQVTLEEYADFSCPECAEVAPALEQLLESYGGTVKFIFRNFPSPKRKESLGLHRIAVRASKLGKFWAVHDLLYSLDHPIHEDLLKTSLSELGMPAEEMTKSEIDVYDRIINRDVEIGKSLGVNRTPFLLVDGQPVPENVTLGDVKKLIDRRMRSLRGSEPANRK